MEDYGGWLQCCSGRGYWTDQAPLAKDMWAGELLHRSGPFWLIKAPDLARRDCVEPR